MADLSWSWKKIWWMKFSSGHRKIRAFCDWLRKFGETWKVRQFENLWPQEKYYSAQGKSTFRKDYSCIEAFILLFIGWYCERKEFTPGKREQNLSFQSNSQVSCGIFKTVLGKNISHFCISERVWKIGETSEFF